jgi:ABC-2 type transport system ATP-binding protein
MPLISARRLTKKFGAQTALDQIDLDVNEGVIGLLGPNGAGKTTFIRLVLRMESVTSGELSAFGHDCAKVPLLVRSSIGYSPEREAYIPGMTAVDMVYFAARLSGLPNSDAIQRTHSVLHFVGIDEARYRRVQTFSTGMKQKVKLAQAIVHNPKLIILDEPTTGLDPSGRLEILDMIRALYDKEKISVLLSTHILHDVESICDSAIVIHQGKVVTQAPIQELRRSRETSYDVRVSGSAEAFAQKLVEAGLSARALPDGRIRVTGAVESGGIFRAAVETGMAVRKFGPTVSTLDEVFLKMVT